MAEQTLGYEQARDELLDVVRRLEAGGVTLEESLTLWERGEQLSAICQQWLDGARARLAAARESGDGPQAGAGGGSASNGESGGESRGASGGDRSDDAG